MFLFFKDIRDGAKYLSYMCEIYGIQHWRKFNAKGNLVWLATTYFKVSISAYFFYDDIYRLSWSKR